ncbi:N-acetylmuramoyl-L-alanine amidase [Tenacibaculum phage PTm1]|uniref:N-acetylmuramoyl-L-alanine amidase n=2 Tax=Shirahamavirus PTm1 TaxID=2846435 RepID=A0A5S9ERN9_9CAUD|nr:N-acetylmuramoyl-L-alanine amidase [Tenacibaculum phage PTm1]BBI90661.1 N-acetylmuramoyl-L-alanine amidase [Tenacibaculum phage PTm1]BBI90966.1 N-acetylmuramoyl-L-alanine amidase [Tenacibaculum phage PTm5]
MYLEKCLTSEEILNVLSTRIKEVPFPSNQYYKEVFDKNQIVLHHTVSDGSSAKGDIATWLQSTARVSTSIIITENGIIHQCFDANYWGHALGLKRAYLKSKGFKDYLYRNKKLNKGAIQIELDSLGPVKSNGHSVAYGGRLRTNDIITYDNPYRGYKHFEKYSDDALETLYYLLRNLTEVYEIPTKYNEDMWDVSHRALNGADGIWTHTSYRVDKSDCHPDPNLIEVLKTLN